MSEYEAIRIARKHLFEIGGLRLYQGQMIPIDPNRPEDVERALAYNKLAEMHKLES